jgi:predicted CoA-substrate-specific enzyme activase
MITAGLDLGSTYVKAVVLIDGIVKGHGVLPTGPDHDTTAKEALELAMKMAGIAQPHIEYIVSTGYGRRVASLANETISEISANGEGTRFVASKLNVRTIIDIGGQDTKVIALDDNLNILNFAMNDKCAAGTGRFIEALSKVIGVGIENMGPLSLASKEPVKITSTCVVFARTEVLSLIAQGRAKEDIIAGIHDSLAKRIAAMAKKVSVRKEVFFDGGPAKNLGMKKALESELGVPLLVPEQPQIVTATGAAMLAAKKLEQKGRRSA